MNFSKIPAASLIGKALRLPLRWIPPTWVMPILQGPCRGSKWVVGSTDHGAWLGSYEQGKQRRIAGMIRPEWVAYDIGANVGVYSMLASHLVGAGHVYAFEPVPRNLEYLHAHIRLNHLTNITVVEKAVCDQIGSMRFNLGASPSMGYLDSGGALEVQTISLDAFVEQARERPNLMKIDVEGGEEQVLLGAGRLLREHPPLIYLATHGPALHRVCCGILSRNGYVLRSVDERPLEETDEIEAFPPNAAVARADQGSATK